MRTLIQRLLGEGITPEIRTLLQDRLDGDKGYVDHAKDEWHRDGEIEIDDDAIVSESDEGAYVQAWVWVDRPGE